MALQWCRKENIKTIIGLGDFIDGYDSNDECVQLVKKHFTACVRGNHDEDHAHHISDENKTWLDNLPDTIEFKGWLITHSSPRNCPDEYIRSSVDAWNCFDDCNFKRSIVGHSHHPMLYRYPAENQFNSDALDATGEGQLLDDSYRYLLVNPSLSYNRSGQQDPGFSVFDQATRCVKFIYLNMPQIDRRG